MPRNSSAIDVLKLCSHPARYASVPGVLFFAGPSIWPSMACETLVIHTKYVQPYACKITTWTACTAGHDEDTYMLMYGYTLQDLQLYSRGFLDCASAAGMAEGEKIAEKNPDLKSFPLELSDGDGVAVLALRDALRKDPDLLCKAISLTSLISWPAKGIKLQSCRAIVGNFAVLDLVIPFLNQTLVIKKVHALQWVLHEVAVLKWKAGMEKGLEKRGGKNMGMSDPKLLQ